MSDEISLHERVEAETNAAVNKRVADAMGQQAVNIMVLEERVRVLMTIMAEKDREIAALKKPKKE